MSVKLTSRIPQIVSRAQAMAPVIVAKTAFDIEAGAKERVPPRVDTGNMRDSIQATPTGHLEMHVVAGAEYTIHHEYGTRHMSAHPMLTPAAEDARPGFERAVASLYR